MTTDFVKELKSDYMELYDIEKNRLTSLNEKSPPVIGCFVADKNGKTLFKYEIFKGALNFYLTRDLNSDVQNYRFDIELIPMFISALERFSQEINIQDLKGLKLKGSNIKIQTYFNFENHSIIFIFNPTIDITLLEHRIKNYFTHLFTVYAFEFNNFKIMSSYHFIHHLELLGKIWLTDLCNLYLNAMNK